MHTPPKFRGGVANTLLALLFGLSMVENGTHRLHVQSFPTSTSPTVSSRTRVSTTGAGEDSWRWRQSITVIDSLLSRSVSSRKTRTGVLHSHVSDSAINQSRWPSLAAARSTSSARRIACVSQRNAALQLSSSLTGQQPDPQQQEQFLMFLYRIGKYLMGTMGAILFVMPDRTLTTLLSAKLGGAAGFAIVSGLCHVLVQATQHHRLSSDTYQRLNVGLLGFFTIGLFAIPGEAAFLPQALPAILLATVMTILRLYGLGMAFLGWKYGVVSSKDTPSSSAATTRRFAWLSTVETLMTHLAQGAKDTAMGIVRVRNKKKAMAYRNSILLVGMGMFSSFMEGLFDMEFRERFLRTWFEISLQWSAVGRLFLIATILYTLKDAAERDRLTGTTFIQLHWLIVLWSGLVGFGQSVYLLGFAPQRGVIMYSISLLYMTKAIKTQKAKDLQQQQKKSNDNNSS